MDPSLYVKSIKTALRAAGVTYAALARRLRMTESGVKKMLNAKDISFGRVLAICDVLEILPGQLLALSERASVPELGLSAKQERALLGNRALVAVYWMIAIEKRAPSEVSRRLAMTASELKRHLGRLVTLEMLVRANGRYRARYRGKFRWPDTSALAMTLNDEWSRETLTRALSMPRLERSFHRLVALRLSRASYEALSRELSDLLETAVRTSEREELTMNPNDLENGLVLLAMLPRGIFDDDVLATTGSSSDRSAKRP